MAVSSTVRFSIAIGFFFIVNFQHVQGSDSVMKLDNIFPSHTTVELKSDIASTRDADDQELRADFWLNQGQDTLLSKVKAAKELSDKVMQSKEQMAKSAVLVVGAGMSMTTLTGARTVLSKPIKKETYLSFEELPVVGMSKTYCIDTQVGNAFCTASAYLRGEQGYRSPPAMSPEECSTKQHTEDPKLFDGSILQWALESGKDVGIVTTSSLTDLPLAVSYASPSSHDFGCQDLANQLINQLPGKDFKVILGGGLAEFLPNSTSPGVRQDSKNLVAEWKTRPGHRFVSTRDGLLKNSSADYLLGLFAAHEMQYKLLANEEEQPSLQEMTEAAIKILSKSTNGFFLFVYGGRIQHAHEGNLARIALDETLEVSKAVQSIKTMTDPASTLVVVTADHGSTMTLAGYPLRWSDLLGEVHEAADDNMSYVEVSYAGGPGFRGRDGAGGRMDVTKEQKFINGDPLFRYPANVPLDSSPAGGEDVPVFAMGPAQDLFAGVHPQFHIPHKMAHSLCIGPGVLTCKWKKANSGATKVTSYTGLCMAAILIFSKFLV